jgi:hypothetical protein
MGSLGYIRKEVSGKVFKPNALPAKYMLMSGSEKRIYRLPKKVKEASKDR